MSLHGKVAIVTGGNSGIGKAIALALAKAGANIVIDYIVASGSDRSAGAGDRRAGRYGDRRRRRCQPDRPAAGA